MLDPLLRLPQRVLIALVQAYRLLLKPWLGNACRFEPTCSAYALQALQQHGALVGSTLAAGRVLRCHPWCDGGCDPVPDKAPALFTRLGLGERDDPSLDKKKLT
jgi:putative membrane protein insertion efficiency factor